MARKRRKKNKNASGILKLKTIKNAHLNMVKTIEIETDNQLIDVAQKFAHTLHNLRFYTKYWNEHGGYQARDRMNHWQQRADELLNSYGLTTHNNTDAVKIIKY
jgi:hypothetical protein